MNKLYSKIMVQQVLQGGLRISLIALSSILFLFLIKEIYYLVVLFFIRSEKTSGIDFLEVIINYFLYFEFIALILKYFNSGDHFPLHYFIYISITAILRLIIVDHSHPFNTLIYSSSIFIQVIALKFTDLKS